MIKQRGLTPPPGPTVTSGAAGPATLDAKHRHAGLVPASPFGSAAPAVTSGASFGISDRPRSPAGTSADSRPHTRARSRSRAFSDDVLADADTSATETEFVLAMRSEDERSSELEDNGEAGGIKEDRKAGAEEAPSNSAGRQHLKRAVSNEGSESGPSPDQCEATEQLMRCLSEMEHTSAALETKIGQAEEDKRTLQVVLASTQRQWRDTLSVNAQLLAEQQAHLEAQHPPRGTRATKRQRTTAMVAAAEMTAAAWRPQLSAASYPPSGTTITSSYPGHLQTVAGAPILHMACILPRIDTGAALPAGCAPAAGAATRGWQRGCPAGGGGGGRPVLRAQPETANNSDAGGSGDVVLDAEAAHFEAALDVELSGLADFVPDAGCEDPLAALLLGTDSMMLPDSWL